MKPSLLNKLERLAERRAEIERELSSPAVIGEQEKFRRLSQEYAQLGPLAEGESGPGRMSEPGAIVSALADAAAGAPR